MRKPPVPSELNPEQHREEPGEPPANYPEPPEEPLAEQYYDEEERERSEALEEERRREDLGAPAPRTGRGWLPG